MTNIEILKKKKTKCGREWDKAPGREENVPFSVLPDGRECRSDERLNSSSAIGQNAERNGKLIGNK